MSETYTARTKYDDRVAERYRTRAEGRRGPENAILRRLLDAHPGTKLILDAPCGVGRVHDVLGEDDVTYVGIDLSSSMLELAAERGAAAGRKRMVHVRGDLERMPIGDRRFEMTVCLRFLHHLPDETRARVLEELARVTGRTLIVTFFHPFALHWVSRKFKDLFRSQKNPRYSHTAGWMARILGPMGFKLTHTEATGLLRETWYAVFEAESSRAR